MNRFLLHHRLPSSRRPWTLLKNRDLRERSENRQSGQIVVEYVLLLVIAVGIAAILTKGMISRTKGSEGFVITTWEALIVTIGLDSADDIRR